MPLKSAIRPTMTGSVRPFELPKPIGEKTTDSYFALGAILLASFGLRLVCMSFLTGAIGTEGAEYARIAENLLAGKGYVGISTPGTELMFPPLLAFLIAAFSFLTHQVETAGRLVSVLMGTLLVSQVYLIAARLYGHQVAKVAGALAAIHPLILTYSTAVYSEVTFAALVLTAVYWSQQCYDGRQLRTFVLAGFFYGLAYLTRPEGIYYSFLTVVLLLGFQLHSHRRRLPRIAFYGSLLIATSLTLAAPYVAWLLHETGQLRTESVGAIIYATDQPIASGRNPSDVLYGIDQNLDGRGVWMVSNLAVIQSTKMSVAGIIQIVEAGLKYALPQHLKTITIAPSFGSLVLFGFTLLGLIFTKWDRKTIWEQLFPFMLLGVTGSLTLLHPYVVSQRYVFLFLPFMIIWAAKGIAAFSQWSGARLAAAVSFALPARQAVPMIKLACVAVISLISLVGLYHFTPLYSLDYRNTPVKLAGQWLDEHSPGPKTVIDTTTLVAFHARASYLDFPYSSVSSALGYIEKNKVNYVVLMSDAIDDSIPFLKKWVNDGIPDARAQLIYTSESSATGRIVIYRWSNAAPLP